MLKRILSPLREFGPMAGLAYLADRALRALSPGLGLYLYELMMQPVSHDALLPARMLRNLQFVEIGRGHEDLARMPAREDIKASRFEQGARCVGAYRNGRLIGYAWFCFGAYDEDEVRCSYDLAKVEPAAWDFDVYIFPEHRMGVGFSAVWHGAFQFLRGLGIERSFSRVTHFNVASRRAHARLGSVGVGRLMVLKLWPIELMLASVRPFVGLSWSRRHRMRLSMRIPGGAAKLRADEAIPPPSGGNVQSRPGS